MSSVWSLVSSMTPSMPPHPRHHGYLLPLYAHKDHNFLFASQSPDGQLDADQILCSMCNRWFSVKNAPGNLRKHLVRHHKGLVPEKEVEQLSQEEKVTIAK